MVHLNNAGASPVSARTLATMTEYLELEREMGGYEAAAAKAGDLSRFYDVAAAAVGAHADTIAFVDSATRGLNTIIRSARFEAGDNIVTSVLEFGSNAVCLQHVSELRGVELRILPVKENGHIDPIDLARALDDRTKLAVFSHAPAHCGTVLNAEEIGAVVKGTPALFVLDACQTLGQFALDVEKLRCDVLVATGRKWLRGPRGTGFIYVRPAVLEAFDSVSLDLANADLLKHESEGSFLSVAKTARRFQTWERSFAGQLGLTNALSEFLERPRDTNEIRIKQLRDMVTAAILSNPRLKLYPGGNDRSGVVTFYHAERPADDLKHVLLTGGVNVSTMHDWDAPWDFWRLELPPLIRVSAHYTNSDQDIDRFAEICGEL